MDSYTVRQFTCPKAVTYPTTNRAQCSADMLSFMNILNTCVYENVFILTCLRVVDSCINILHIDSLHTDLYLNIYCRYLVFSYLLQALIL